MPKKTIVSRYYDKIADHYEEDYVGDPYWKLYNEITWLNIKKHLPKKKDSLLIDVGGGTGYWARKLAKLGYNVVVTDISERMLEIGRKKARKEKLHKKIFFTYADIVDMRDLRSDRYDFVLCEGDPLSYCSDPEKGVKELVRIAKSGAVIVASVDNFFSALKKAVTLHPEHLASLLKTHVSNFFGVHPQYNFTPEEIRGLFQANGCQVLSLIGKPVIAHHDVWRHNPNYRRLLSLEKKFNSRPSLVANGGHLEIVVKKG